ncbi:MAG: hypothetical protein QNJ19_04315 [Woeseiaceae bacterium]|nr:hypothetical protein [Woeseiaceae bacterium]
MKKLGLAGLLACTLATAAAADIGDQLKICAAIEDADARLACFDAIGRATPAEAPTEEEAPVPPAVEAAPPAPEVDETPAATAVPAVSEEAVVEAVEPAPAESAAEVAPAVEAEDDFGLDSMTEREKERLAREADKAEAAARKQAEKEAREKERNAVVKARIIRVQRHSDGRFSVTLDNGQVWRETQGSRVGIPGEGAMVELTKGRFGGYRMNIDGLYRTAWVKRTK